MSPTLDLLCHEDFNVGRSEAAFIKHWRGIIIIIRWRSISMRAGPAFLQFDWLKASLSMDLPVFVYSHTKTSFRFLSRQRKYREAFYVVTDLLLQATQREPYRALVLSRLRLARSTDHEDRNLHSLSHRFQSSCS